MHSFDTTTWCFSAPRVGDDVAGIARLAADKGCDIVHIACAIGADEPLSVSLVIHERGGVRWIPNVRLYAAGDSAPVELLANRDRWSIGARRCLHPSDLPSEAHRAEGEAIAWRRWRDMVSQMEEPDRDGMVWVPRGGTIEDAIPYDRIKVTA